VPKVNTAEARLNRRVEDTGAEVRDFFRKLADDQRGGEVLEYAIILGVIAIAALTLVTSYGSKVLARWQTLNSSM
jgi:Flp pilus assembly pilin Flp